MKSSWPAFTLILYALTTGHSLAQETGPSPYQFTSEQWLAPFAQQGRTWGGLDIPLSIIVGTDSAWVTDLRSPKLIKIDFDGNREYTWHLPVEGPNMWIETHSMAVAAEGSLYATDNQADRKSSFHYLMSTLHC